MTMGTSTETDRQRRTAELAKEIGSVARQLAEHCLAVDLAVASGDFDVVYGSSEKGLELGKRWALLSRELLVARTSSSRLADYSSL
jgi:hypothetical protein